jgi:hypothetical protein
MAETIEQILRTIAAGRCEYCHIPEEGSRLGHVVDHVIARQHGGPTELPNLALCCGRCNGSKGPNIAGIDPDTGQLTRLFHPRQDRWADHFRYDGPVLVGLTPVGRASVRVLGINLPIRVTVRRVLMETEVRF